MKTKTEAKRQAILKAAGEVFRELGFERTSMSEICARVGGSKATLYNYFPSKEKLFFEVMFQATVGAFQDVVAALNPDSADLKAELLQFGQKLLPVLYSPEAVAIRRLAIAESNQSQIGTLCFEQATVRMEKRVGEFLKKAMKRGTLRSGDPKVAAIHLLSLLEAELLQRLLLGVLASVKPEAINAAVRRAVEAFLSGYGKR